jgi:hypothetical protein
LKNKSLTSIDLLFWWRTLLLLLDDVSQNSEHLKFIIINNSC